MNLWEEDNLSQWIQQLTLYCPQCQEPANFQRFYCILSLEKQKWMVLLYIIIGNMEMDGFTVYYHRKHGNGWFYCKLSLERGNRKWMDWPACEHTKEIIQTSNCKFRFVTKQYSYKHSHPTTGRGSQQPHSLPRGISSHATYKKGRGHGHLVVTCHLFFHFLSPFLFSLNHIPLCKHV